MLVEHGGRDNPRRWRRHEIFDETWFYFSMRFPTSSTLFPYTTLIRSFLEGDACLLTFVGNELAGYTWVHAGRSEEHTSELQSRRDLVCRLPLVNKATTRSTKPRKSLSGRCASEKWRSIARSGASIWST